MVHGRDENLQCLYCGKTFKNQPSLRAHTRQSHYEFYLAERQGRKLSHEESNLSQNESNSSQNHHTF